MLLRSLAPGLDGPQVLGVGDGALLIAWDTGTSGTTEPVIGGDGFAAGRARATLRLPLAGGGIRVIHAVRLTGRPAGPLNVGGHPIPMPAVPIDDPGILIDGLDQGAKARLLAFVLGICRSTFRLRDTPAFAAFSRRLLTDTGAETLQFAPKVHLASGHLIYGTSGAHSFGTIEAIYAATTRRVREIHFRPLIVPAETGTIQVSLAAPAWVSDPAVEVVLVGASAAVRAKFAPAIGVPSLASLAEHDRLDPAERHYALHCLGAIGDAPAVASARVLQILAPERPRVLSNSKQPIGAALELSVGCGGVGVFARGWVRDPYRLVQDTELESPFGRIGLGGSWHRLPRPDLAKAWGRQAARDPNPGFVALAPLIEPLPVLQHRLRLVSAGGPIETVPPIRVLSEVEARDAVLASVAPQYLSDEILTRTIAPATAALHRAVMERRAEPDIVTIGEPPADPEFAVIVPLYRNLGFLRIQVAAFAADPDLRDRAEIIYVLDSPEQRAEVEHLLRGLRVVTGLSFRLVVMSANYGFAAATNSGARAARARWLMLLNSDVIPVASGWLATLRDALDTRDGSRMVGAVGPKLLFDDGSLQHAGLRFARDLEGRWYNAHYFKGYPRDWPAANRPRMVPAVTGAAMLVARECFEQVGGLSEDYVVGDYEDSDFCLKLRAAGFDIRYEPRAELHHFERRSITLNPGYVGTAASAYNRRLHAERWSSLMADLAAAFEGGEITPAGAGA